MCLKIVYMAIQCISHWRNHCILPNARMSYGGWIKKNGNSYSQATRSQYAVCDLWLSIYQLVSWSWQRQWSEDAHMFGCFLHRLHLTADPPLLWSQNLNPFKPLSQLSLSLPLFFVCKKAFHMIDVNPWWCTNLPFFSRGWAENREWDESSTLRLCKKELQITRPEFLRWPLPCPDWSSLNKILGSTK